MSQNQVTQDPETLWINALNKLAMARYFAKLLTVEGAAEVAPEDGLWGHYRVLTEVYEFVAAINAGELKFTPTVWKKNGVCAQQGGDAQKEKAVDHE